MPSRTWQHTAVAGPCERAPLDSIYGQNMCTSCLTATQKTNTWLDMPSHQTWLVFLQLFTAQDKSKALSCFLALQKGYQIGPAKGLVKPWKRAAMDVDWGGDEEDDDKAHRRNKKSWADVTMEAPPKQKQPPPKVKEEKNEEKKWEKKEKDEWEGWYWEEWPEESSQASTAKWAKKNGSEKERAKRNWLKSQHQPQNEEEKEQLFLGALGGARYNRLVRRQEERSQQYKAVVLAESAAKQSAAAAEAAKATAEAMQWQQYWYMQSQQVAMEASSYHQQYQAGTYPASYGYYPQQWAYTHGSYPQEGGLQSLFF